MSSSPDVKHNLYDKEKGKLKIDYEYKTIIDKYWPHHRLCYLQEQNKKINTEEDEVDASSDDQFADDNRIQEEYFEHAMKEFDKKEKQREMEKASYINSKKESMSPDAFIDWYREFMEEENRKEMESLDDWLDEAIYYY